VLTLAVFGSMVLCLGSGWFNAGYSVSWRGDERSLRFKDCYRASKFGNNMYAEKQTIEKGKKKENMIPPQSE
jgi:hypothetical protein